MKTNDDDGEFVLTTCKEIKYYEIKIRCECGADLEASYGYKPRKGEDI